ncbi:MAG: hypothetical protein ACPHET_01375 [Miltoncostaeaceae bacterium]
MTTHDAPRTRRIPGPAVAAMITGGAIVAFWAPSFAATAYAERPASDYLANPAAGWGFLWEAAVASRNPRLGTADAAWQQASQAWAGAPAVASDVSLRAIPDDWTVPVPTGGTGPLPVRRAVQVDDELNWVVTGRVNGGPLQVIGLLDYRTGRVAWDIRPVAGGAR